MTQLHEPESMSRGWQGSAWHLIAAFVTAGALCSAIAAGVAVYVLGWYDSKFQSGLKSALQVGLVDIYLSFFFAAAIFSIAVAMRNRGRNGSVKRAVLFGGLYPIGFILLGRAVMQSDPESLIGMFVGIGYIICYSIVAALATTSGKQM
jgi:MFS family permease